MFWNGLGVSRQYNFHLIKREQDDSDFGFLKVPLLGAVSKEMCQEIAKLTGRSFSEERALIRTEGRSLLGCTRYGLLRRRWYLP